MSKLVALVAGGEVGVGDQSGGDEVLQSTDGDGEQPLPRMCTANRFRHGVNAADNDASNSGTRTAGGFDTPHWSQPSRAAELLASARPLSYGTLRAINPDRDTAHPIQVGLSLLDQGSRH